MHAQSSRSPIAPSRGPAVLVVLVACSTLMIPSALTARGDSDSAEASEHLVATSWVQVGARNPGLHGSLWRTDLGLRNVGSAAATVEIKFHPAGGGAMVSASAQVAAGAQSVLEDVVGQLGADGAGALEIVASQPLIVTSRTYNLIADGSPCTPGGTFGQYYAGYTQDETLANGESAWLPHLAESSRFRSNIALTNTGTVPATVWVELFDGVGTPLVTFDVPLNPGQYRQETQVFKNRAGQTNVQRGSARVTIIAGSAVIASASVVDNTTNDPTTIPMLRQPAVPATLAWIQVAARNPGLHGSQWRTDLGLLNVSDGPATATVRFYPATGGAMISASAQVAAGAQSALEDVVGQLGASGAGALEVVSAQPLIVTSRTYNLIADASPCTPGGTFGQFYAGYTPGETLSNGESAWLPHLAESSRFRSNIALTNTGTVPATVRVELFDGAGSPLATFNVPLNPGQYRQETQVFKNRAGQTNLPRGSARATVIAGSGVIASASVVDNTTNDPTTIPMLNYSATTPGEEITILLPGDVPLVMVEIPRGTFMMGSPTATRGVWANEWPQHQVTLSQDYYLGKYPVTQGQWLALMGTNPSGFAGCGLDCPVERISWEDVCGGTTGSDCVGHSFIGRLRAHLAATGQPGADKVRMPTEAEWERGARGGTRTRYSYGDALECGDACEACPLHDQYMWWCGNSGGSTHPVGQKMPNTYGLYDMHGNVMEWVADWFLGSYPSGPRVDPAGPPTGSSRVGRGGRWDLFAKACRSASRDNNSPGVRGPQLGFRLARSK